MAVDKNKIIAEATKLVQKGAYDKAIAAYQKILAGDPKDVRILLKVGELHQKKGDGRSAALAFEKVAETYSEQGFFLKAVAVYKQIVKLDPDDVRVNERLAGLYQQLGLVSDAMSQYQFMAAAYERSGDGSKLTDVLRRMVELDPDNIASSIKLGELYARSAQVGPALECFRRAADYLKRHNRADEYLKVAERIASLSPNDLALTRELANIHLAKGDTKRALAKLQLCFKADPRDVETLTLLAQAFRDLGQTSKTVSVYKELARVHEEHGRANEARSIWRRVQELAPDDEEAAAAVGVPQRAVAPAPFAAAPPPGPPPGAVRAPAPGRPPGAVAAQAPMAPPPSGPDAIAKLLTETDVYVKYGLHDKALDHLRKIVALDPQCGEAHEKAREVLLAAGRGAEAGRAGALAVRAFAAKGAMDEARDAVSRLRQIAPEHPELRELNVAVGGTEEVELDGAEIEEEVVLAAGEVTEEPEIDDDALALAAAGSEDEEVIEDEPAEEHEPEQEGSPEPVLALEDDDALAEAAALASADEVVEPPQPTKARPRTAPAPRPPPRAAPPPEPEPPPDEEADLSDEIEEAEFFAQQGLWDEARDALRNLLAFYPDHAVLRRKLEEVERKSRAAGPDAVAPPADAGADESFDIARELAAELVGAPAGEDAAEEFQYSVEDVFSQFKKGVEQTVRREDSATHYDLGIAYKEMGLVDDAIHEFEIALDGNDRKKEVDCLSMIGLCRMSKGEPAEAVKAYRRALRSDHLSKDAAKAIHFELATAYEAKEDREAALYYFQRVVKADAAFRNAGARVAALGGGPGRAPPEEAAPRPRAASAEPRSAAPPRAGAGAGAAVGAKKNIGYL